MASVFRDLDDWVLKVVRDDKLEYTGGPLSFAGRESRSLRKVDPSLPFSEADKDGRRGVLAL